MHRVQLQNSSKEPSHNTHAHPHRTQTIRMHHVQLQSISKEQSHKTHAHPHRGQTIRMHHVQLQSSDKKPSRETQSTNAYNRVCPHQHKATQTLRRAIYTLSHQAVRNSRRVYAQRPLYTVTLQDQCPVDQYEY